MKTVSFQGTRLTATDRRRLEQQRRLNPVRPGVDWDSLRENINSRMFVGPKAPVVVPEEIKDEWYWKLVSNFKRYGYTEVSKSGTPYVGSAFGYQQELSA